MSKEAEKFIEKYTTKDQNDWLVKKKDIIARFMESYHTEQLTIPVVVVSEAELCDNPHCEDGVVDSDMYGHPIYCQVCDKHN